MSDLLAPPEPGVVPDAYVADSYVRAAQGSLIFSPLTDWIVVILASLLGGGLLLFATARPTALLTPVDPGLRAGAIGAGVFVGVLLAGVATDAWKLGIAFTRRPAPRGIAAMVSLLVLIGACGMGGDTLAAYGVEWRAFHGLVPIVRDQGFRVTNRNQSIRFGDSLELVSDGGAQVTLHCDPHVFAAVAVGDRLVLPVETGRDGVQRMTLTSDPRQLRRPGAAL